MVMNVQKLVVLLIALFLCQETLYLLYCLLFQRLERSRNMAKEKKKELLPGYHWECKYCDGRHAKRSPYEEKKFMVCASCGAEWEDCKIPVPDGSIW